MNIEPLTETGRDEKGTGVCKEVRNSVLNTFYLNDAIWHIQMEIDVQ